MVRTAEDDRTRETLYDLGSGSTGTETVEIQQDTRIPLRFEERVDGVTVLTIDVVSLIVGDVKPIALDLSTVFDPNGREPQAVATVDALPTY